MKNTGVDTPSRTAGSEQTKPKDGKLTGPATECKRDYTRAVLRHFLFRKRAGGEVNKDVEEHLEKDDCGCCQREVIELEAGEPYLYDDKYQLPGPHVDVIETGRGDGNPTDNQLIAEVARKVAKPLQAPANPYPLNELFVMYGSIRSVSDPQKRQTIAERVRDDCRKRWNRVVMTDGPEVEAAAAKLLTHLASAGEKSIINTRDDLELPEQETAAFLNYMMTEDYFFNLRGRPTWEIHVRAQPPAETPGDGESSGQTIDLNLGVLREALKSNRASLASKVPTHV